MQRLSLVPTPIGNLQDITERALYVLKNADVVAAEDTRRTRGLLREFGITAEIVRLDVHTMPQRGPRLFENSDIDWLAYVSDAGTPGISDPGLELIHLAQRYGVAYEVLPGPTAFVPALVLSGFPTARFTFEGFLPRKGSERNRRIAAIANRPITTVLYESPQRLLATLADLAAVCSPERQVSVSREISKLFEETKRGTIAEVQEYFAEGTKGEIVVVISPLIRSAASADDSHAELLAQAAHQAGLAGRDLSTFLTNMGVARNEAYELANTLGATGALNEPTNEAE